MSQKHLERWKISCAVSLAFLYGLYKRPLLRYEFDLIRFYLILQTRFSLQPVIKLPVIKTLSRKIHPLTRYWFTYTCLWAIVVELYRTLFQIGNYSILFVYLRYNQFSKQKQSHGLPKLCKVSYKIFNDFLLKFPVRTNHDITNFAKCMPNSFIVQGLQYIIRF